MKKQKPAKRKRKQKPSQDGFLPSERAIFRYWNGTKWVSGDPMKIHRQLIECPDANLELDSKLLLADTPELPHAYARLVAAVRSVFAIPEFAESDDGKRTGLLDSECMGLLKDFGQFQIRIMEETRPFATSPPTTAEPSSAAPSPTANSAASTSTAPELCIAALTA